MEIIRRPVEIDRREGRSWGRSYNSPRFLPILVFFELEQIVKNYKLLIASAKIPELEGSISPSSFYGKLPDY